MVASSHLASHVRYLPQGFHRPIFGNGFPPWVVYRKVQPWSIPKFRCLQKWCFRCLRWLTLRLIFGRFHGRSNGMVVVVVVVVNSRWTETISLGFCMLRTCHRALGRTFTHNLGLLGTVYVGNLQSFGTEVQTNHHVCTGLGYKTFHHLFQGFGVKLIKPKGRVATTSTEKHDPQKYHPGKQTTLRNVNNNQLQLPGNLHSINKTA